jgi:hypothetical protein
MRYARPNTDGSKVRYASRYGNFIGGEFVKPVKGQYFENPTPVTGNLSVKFRARRKKTSSCLDGGAEARAGARRGQLRGARARRADARDDLLGPSSR